MRNPMTLLASLLTLALIGGVSAQTTAPSDRVEFPAVTVDRVARQVRVACEALSVDAPLEFFCVANGGPEHESVLRTAAKPSHIHAGLLMLGLEPGSPVQYVASKNAWSAPFGPPIRVSVEWKSADGTTIHRTADQLLKPTGKAPAPAAMRWIFAGSHQREDGTYLADLTGYVVTLVNFEHALIDVPRLVGSANETLEWQTAPDAPKRGEPVTMILEPLADPTTVAATQPAEVGLTPEQARVQRDVAAMRDEWRATMQPHEAAVREAAKAHYAFIARLQERQRKLVEEADQIEALIDELDRAYEELTTPKP